MLAHHKVCQPRRMPFVPDDTASPCTIVRLTKGGDGVAGLDQGEGDRDSSIKYEPLDCPYSPQFTRL